MALGKGLGSILEEMGSAYEQELREEAFTSDNIDNVLEIKVDEIDPNPYQPRKEFDSEKLKELGESIVEHGLLQPIVVVPEGDRYILIAGERRLRAHKLMGISTIRAITADIDFDEIKLRELALVENIQRENLNPVELAQAYRELIESHGITHEALAQILHKSRSHITNTLRLLNLTSYTQQKLIEGKISQGHAKILVGLDENEQKIIVDTIIGRKLSVRDTESIVKNRKSIKNVSTVEKKENIWTKERLEQLDKILSFKYKIRKNSLEICFDSAKELDNFIYFLNEREN